MSRSVARGPKRLVVSVVLAAALGGPTPTAMAQQPPPPDTTAAVKLEAVVVTAERRASMLGASAAAVSRLSAAELARAPRVTLADALREVPGVAVVDFEGAGHAPQLMVRGFYGGGEAEYVVVLVDGVPLGDVQAGLVRWDAVPLAAIERVEVVRGGSSALYGDAAIGAVVNVITRAALGERAPRWQLGGGSHGAASGSGSVGTPLLGRELGVFAGFDRTDGFRAHAERTAGRAGGRYALMGGEGGALSLSALSQWRDFEEPGPLTGDALAADRRASDVFHRFDRTTDASHRLGLHGERPAGTRGRLSASLAGEARSQGAVRTIALAPTFADTKERVLGTGHALGTVQLAVDGGARPDDRLVVGADASYGTLDSEYYTWLAGPRAAYQAAGGGRGELDASGRARRGAAAVFAQYTLVPTAAVSLSLGARADWLSDRFEPGEPRGGEPLQASHGALSPRAGVNVRWLSTATQTGHVYLAGGRSFKAPTLDQLFDQRSFPVPFPPFRVETSNALLVPQRGVSAEAGLYHAVGLVPGALAGELSLAAYQMDMKDELDFDLQSLRYVNLGRSRHRGLETGLNLRGPRATIAFLNYTLQHATERGGAFDGKQLKAIPRQVVSGGASASLLAGLEAGLRLDHVRGVHLDDENTVAHPPYTRLDARFSYPVAGVLVLLDVRNVLDARYSTTGFPDPSGSDVLYYHPAAGRTLEFGLRTR